ncbi:glycosyltransferase, partial [Candidatus Microgenomates bacterium]|nr:glycosyltransferase [Candidatus Microgenomates bacterium]
SFGVPVVASNVSSLPEVVGKAGVLVDPGDVKDISRGINEVLNYNELKRQEMIKKGLEQVKKFSWEKCAKETLGVLVEVGKGNKLI